MNDEKVQKSLGEVLKHAFKELGETLVAFIKAPRALWGINLPYIIEGLCYFGLIYILTTYCFENVKLSDIHSGWVVGGVTWGNFEYPFFRRGRLRVCPISFHNIHFRVDT